MKVMIVEDDENIRSALTRYLTSQGLNTSSTGSAFEAISLINNDVPDLVITDWDLGEALTGVDVANYLQTLSSHTIVVFITGKSLSQLKVSATHLTVHTFMQKPFRLADVKRLIEEIRN